MDEIISRSELPLLSTESNKKDDNNSLDKIPEEESKVFDSVKGKTKLNTNAYKRRNVYKSIIRHMLSYHKKNPESMKKLLQSEGFGKSEIESAFEYIIYLNELDKQKGKAKRPQNSINMMLIKRNIHTYILRETLNSMLNVWKEGSTGKLNKANISIYREVCEKYCARCNELIEKKA